MFWVRSSKRRTRWRVEAAESLFSSSPPPLHFSFFPSQAPSSACLDHSTAPGSSPRISLFLSLSTHPSPLLSSLSFLSLYLYGQPDQRFTRGPFSGITSRWRCTVFEAQWNLCHPPVAEQIRGYISRFHLRLVVAPPSLGYPGIRQLIPFH